MDHELQPVTSQNFDHSVQEIQDLSKVDDLVGILETCFQKSNVDPEIDAWRN